MFPSRTKLLNRIYNHTLKTGEPLSLSLDDETSPEYRLTDQIQKDIDYLTDNGYVKDEYDIIGSAHLVLTEKVSSLLKMSVRHRKNLKHNRLFSTLTHLSPAML